MGREAPTKCSAGAKCLPRDHSFAPDEVRPGEVRPVHADSIPSYSEGEPIVTQDPGDGISVTTDGGGENIRPEIMHLKGSGRWESPTSISNELASFT